MTKKLKPTDPLPPVPAKDPAESVFVLADPVNHLELAEKALRGLTSDGMRQAIHHLIDHLRGR
jgi:hypothetical protein